MRQGVQNQENNQNGSYKIIAVDDGSTDSSYEMLSEYDDPRLRIYSKENEGLYKTWKYK